MTRIGIVGRNLVLSISSIEQGISNIEGQPIACAPKSLKAGTFWVMVFIQPKCYNKLYGSSSYKPFINKQDRCC